MKPHEKCSRIVVWAKESSSSEAARGSKGARKELERDSLLAAKIPSRNVSYDYIMNSVRIERNFWLRGLRVSAQSAEMYASRCKTVYNGK